MYANASFFSGIPKKDIYRFRRNRHISTRTPCGCLTVIIMCLYPRLIRNRKYIPNKKNGGHTPHMKDSRTEFVPVGCGKCIECRKQKARAWQVRLHEELKVQKYRYFVTMTFSNENLKKLANDNNETNVNRIAAIAVRMFLERWRKKYKKSLRHWLVTELGQENTERIHIHGILFPNKPLENSELESIWKYGWTDTGKYCSERSVNYIVKYIYKLDLTHKNYEPIILCSAGLGRAYIDKQAYAHVYKPKNTKEYYTLNNGTKINLPIYYRNHFFTEEEREQLWLEKLDKHTIYVNGIECKNIHTQKGLDKLMRTLTEQQEMNKRLGYGDASLEWKRKTYNITAKMLNNRENDT